MKRKVTTPPPPSARTLSGPKYWRSLEELFDTPEFQEQLDREFPPGASELEGVDRRNFLKIMAASFALGGLGLAGCRRPEKYILPYGKSVEGVIPGLPIYFATAMPLRRGAIPLLAETHEGRPTKLEGNPTYAPHGTATSMIAQASLLDLYDPERATAHIQNDEVIDAAAVNTLLADVGTSHAANGGAGLAFLAETSASPTRARLVTQLRQQFPQAVWAEFDPITDEPPPAAARAAFGRDVKPVYRFAQARRIVSLDADFLQAESGHIYYSREFARGRRVAGPDDAARMSRLYAVESAFTLTGMMADHRLRLSSSQIVAFAAALATRVTGNNAFASLAQGLDVSTDWLDACAADLLAQRGQSLIVAGSHLPPAAHAIAYAINSFLGNIGTTVDFVAVEPSTASTLPQLAQSIQSGGVDTLVILGGNPAYNAPVELNWSDLQGRVSRVIRLGVFPDETAALADVNLAAAHYLESWGDARTADGTILPIQPMIIPLFGGLTDLEVLARILGLEKTDPHDLVFDTITPIAGGDADKAFQKFLHDGILADSAYPVVPVTYSAAGVASLLNAPAALPALSASNLEVRFLADSKMDDGRFANNGWLQECPDPVTKISWDNVIQVSPRLAQEIGAVPGGMLMQVARKETVDMNAAGNEVAPVAELTLGGRTLRGPVHIQPGLANYTIVVPLGYGRPRSGHVGTNSGFNAYPLRTAADPHFAIGGSLRLTGDTMLLANTQTHWSMEGRGIIREANTGEYIENPAYAQEVGMESETPSTIGEVGEAMTPQEQATLIPRGNSLYSTPAKGTGGFDGVHQWGMSIDLNTCTGCSACVVACQAENNIPIVGRDQARRRREMLWIRIDRYYSDGQADPAAFGGEGNRVIPEDPQASVQPVPCQQCELAPCEMVCPVNATVHDEEGLNAMVYNRCIGTRYCANNCPYKVRRFNYFDWNQRELDDLYLGPVGPHGMPELIKLAKNPQVTVRMRGVMEKCTYCVQRIENAKIQHRIQIVQAGTPDQQAVPDGTILTACQQVCPTEAIVFGNLLDTQSAVSQAKARPQDYGLLAYLNTRPRTTYLGRLRNPNPEMPDYRAMPLSRIEHQSKTEPGESEGEGGSSEAAPAGGERTSFQPVGKARTLNS